MGTRPAPRRRGAPLLQTPLDPSNEPRIRRRLGWIVALVALPCAFVFHFWPHVHTANESIRLYFTQALLEGTAPAIDAVSAQQGAAPIDRATYEGRSYLDKAPGLSLLALPVVATLRAIGVPSTGRNLWIHGLFSTILCVTLPLTLAWIALCLALRRRARSASAAAFTTLGLALGSPLFVYATLLFGHATATACILGALLLLSRWPDGVSTPRQAWLGGLLAGLAVLIETTTMPLAGALVAMVWLRSREPPRRRLVLAMPALGGEEVFLVLRNIRPEVPVLLASGFSEDEARRRFGERNVDGFIKKPFRAADLVAALRGVLAGRRTGGPGPARA